MSILKKLKTVIDASAIFATCFLISDIIMIAGSFLLAYWLRVNLEIRIIPSAINFEDYILYVVGITAIWILVFWITGLYHPQLIRLGTGGLYKIIGSSSFGATLIILYFFFSEDLPFSRLIIVYAIILSIFFVFGGRYTLKWIRSIARKHGIDAKRLVIIGNGKQTVKVVNDLINSKVASGFEIVGIISDLKNKQVITENNFKFLGSPKRLKKILDQTKPETLLFTAPKKSSDILNLAEVCHKKAIEFRFIPDTPRLLAHYSVVTNIDGIPIFGVRSARILGWGRVAKRIFDVLVSIITIILFSPFLLAIAIIIKSDGGPILFQQDRIGRDNKTFKLYKFRSMRTDAEKFAKWTVKDDPRITKIGKIIRKTSIDELPQFFNVLEGTMSIVGPRPEQPRFVKKFKKEIPRYTYRHRIKGGITGWAQVNGLRGDTSIEERAKYDLYYIENWTMLSDVKIILMTIRTVLFNPGHTN